jgi:CheY-like chemotaxis protein
MLRVLLVEDNAADCELLAHALRKAAAEVVCADGDLAAYALLDEGRALDVLLTDINLGVGTTGYDVARAARLRYADLRVIYTSRGPVGSDMHRVEGSIVLARATAPRTSWPRRWSSSAARPEGNAAQRRRRSR